MAALTRGEIERAVGEACQAVADRIDADLFQALCRQSMAVPMGPLNQIPDGSTPKPNGILHRCKECTLLRVAKEGDVCEECSNSTTKTKSFAPIDFGAAKAGRHAQCPKCEAGWLQYRVNTDSFNCAKCNFSAEWNEELNRVFCASQD